MTKQTHKNLVDLTLYGLLVAILALLALFVQACATDPATGKRVPDVDRMQSIAKDATAIGTRDYLTLKPEDRGKFIMARNALSALIAAGEFNAADLETALAQLPIKQMQGGKGAILIDSAIILWDAYGQEVTRLDKAQVFETYILPVAKSILDGLNIGLAPPQAQAP